VNIMAILIIYAHPRTGGHCSAMLEEVKLQLDKRGEKYDFLDLYTMNYDPILHEDEHYTAGGYKVSDENKAIQQKITESTKMIFIYPIWWGSMPAILKGFIDRIFVSHYAFQYNAAGLPEGLLKGKKALVLVTSGAPTIFTSILTGNRPARLIQNDILGFCGIKSKYLQLGRSLKFEESKGHHIKSMVGKGLSWLY
jgi:NAD(P)H dehydrogenase (quinone)